MAEFYVSFIDSTGAEVPLPFGLQITPKRYSETAVGGPERAELEVQGPVPALRALLRWLGYRIVIRSRNHSPVWNGIIDEVFLALSGFSVGLSIKEMFNRISVLYTSTEDGATISGQTDWAQDDESIAKYGYKELVYSAADIGATQAISLRDTLLGQYAKPVPVVQVERSTSPHVAIFATGIYATFERRYYAQPIGLEANDVNGDSEQLLGHGIAASTTIGFTRDGKIHDINGKLKSFVATTTIAITGSASNNGSRKVNSAENKDPQIYTATTISFDPIDDVMDSAKDLGFCRTNDWIQISGAGQSSNNGIKRVKDSGAEHMTVAPDTITLEGAGASVSVKRGNTMDTDVTGVTESPGNSVTILTHGQKIAWSFTPSTNATWTVASIAVKIKRVGAPADGVKLDFCQYSAGVPGAVLDTATLSAAAIGKNMDYVAFVLTNTQTVAYGTSYFGQLSRTGSYDADNYYVVEVDEDLNYTGGSLLLWTGSAWVVRSPDADMVFKVLGAWETTAQIQRIYSDIGQYLDGFDLINASGIYSNQYRAGENTGADELEALLQAGTTNGRRLLATVTPDWILRVYEQPTPSPDTNLLLNNDGTLSDVGGKALVHGKLCAGRWVELSGFAQFVDEYAKLSPLFVERAEFDCETGTVSLEPQSQQSAFDFGIKQG